MQLYEKKIRTTVPQLVQDGEQSNLKIDNKQQVMVLWRLRAKTWMSNILKEILSRSMSTTMIHSNAIKSPFHSHSGVKTGLVHINTSILGKTVVCCFIGVTICNQSYNNYKLIPSTMYNSWTQFALGFWVNTPIEHFYNTGFIHLFCEKIPWLFKDFSRIF